MKRLVKQGMFALLFWLAQAATAQQVRIESPVRFLALGDSYTIGQGVPEADRWPVQLAERLKIRGVEVEELTIIAQTGWTTDDLLDAISREKPDSNYNMVSLLIGVNNQYQGIDINKYPDEFRQLLKSAVSLCGGNKEGVFVLSIPDYGYTPFGAGARETISAKIDEYNRINREIAGEMDIAWFDITPISRETISKPEYLAPDHLHPSGEMYSAWVDYIFDTASIKIVATNMSGFNENVEVLVYPNPASGWLNFFMPGKANEITVYNGSGEKVYHAETEFQHSFSTEVFDWEPGIYFYRIKNAGQILYRGKVMIK